VPGGALRGVQPHLLGLNRGGGNHLWKRKNPAPRPNQQPRKKYSQKWAKIEKVRKSFAPPPKSKKRGKGGSANKDLHEEERVLCRKSQGQDTRKRQVGGGFAEQKPGWGGEGHNKMPRASRAGVA